MADPKTERQAFDKWLTRGGGGAAVVVMLWMLQDFKDDVSKNLDTMREDVASVKTQVTRVTTELDLVKPRDLLTALQEKPSKNDVREILKTDAPWIRDREQWLQWRAEMERRLQALEVSNDRSRGN